MLDLINYWCTCVCVCVCVRTQSCLSFCDPTDCPWLLCSWGLCPWAPLSMSCQNPLPVGLSGKNTWGGAISSALIRCIIHNNKIIIQSENIREVTLYCFLIYLLYDLKNRQAVPKLSLQSLKCKLVNQWQDILNPRWLLHTLENFLTSLKLKCV